MERLEYSKETHELLIDMAENDRCYWRYQDSKHHGIIPVGHESHERMFDGEEPEFIEEGASCYDNPWQLTRYMDDEILDLNDTDVVLFVGDHKGYGIDEEDIVQVTEKSDILYSLSLRDFYKFILNVEEDVYWNSYNVKEEFCNFTESFTQEVMEK